MRELAGKPKAQQALSSKSYNGTAPGFQDYTVDEIKEIRGSNYAMIALVDREVGRILDALDASGLAENTLVVFTSDHGEMLGDHAIMLKGPMMYDAVTRVPLLMRWPRRIAAGTRREQIVQWIDLPATYLDAARVPPMPAVQGESLLPLVGTDASSGWRDWALCEYRDSCISDEAPVMTTMLRKGGWKLVVWHGDSASGRAMEGELYDLVNDPLELTNLYNDDGLADVRREMKLALLEIIAATGERSAPRVAPW